MPEPLVDKIPFAKIVIGLAIAFFVSLGLCGLTAIFSSGVNSGFASLGVFELIAMVLSAAGLTLTAIVWVAAAALGSFGKKVSQPQKLFDGEDDTKLDKWD